MTPQEEGLLNLVAERIGALDRRIEDVGRALHSRIDRSDERHENQVKEITKAKDDVHKELWEGLSNVQRSVQMLKGAIAVIVVLVLPFATIAFDHMLR
jgi:hypothetical protein